MILMSENVQIELIKAIPGFLAFVTALVGVLVSWHNKNKIEEVRKDVNSGLTRQLDNEKKIGHAEGVAEEKKENKP